MTSKNRPHTSGFAAMGFEHIVVLFLWTVRVQTTENVVNLLFNHFFSLLFEALTFSGQADKPVLILVVQLSQTQCPWFSLSFLAGKTSLVVGYIIIIVNKPFKILNVMFFSSLKKF